MGFAAWGRDLPASRAAGRFVVQEGVLTVGFEGANGWQVSRGTATGCPHPHAWSPSAPHPPRQPGHPSHPQPALPASLSPRRRLLATWVQHARRHGVPSHKVVPWVRRKLGPTVVVLRFRGDGSLGCSVPCVLCQRELTRFDLSVCCFLGQDAAGGGPCWYRGRLTDEGAPTPVLTAGQRRTLNLDPGPRRPRESAAADADAGAGRGRGGGRSGSPRKHSPRGRTPSQPPAPPPQQQQQRERGKARKSRWH